MPIDMSAAISRPYLNAGEPGEVTHGQVTIDPGTEKADVTRHVALCVDTSGSMEGDRIEMAKEGAIYATGTLDDDDYLSLVTFDGDSQVLLGPVRWGDINRDNAHDEIREMEARGLTDIEAGLRDARSSLDQIPTDPDAVRRIILLSDGEDNDKSGSDFEPIVEDLIDNHTSIMAAGIGEYDEATIKTIGTGEGNKWEHLTDVQEIRAFLSGEVSLAGTVLETKPELRFDTAGGTELRDVYRCVPQVQQADVDWDGSTVVVTLPDLKEEEKQLVVFEMVAPKGEEGDVRKVADVTFEASERQQTELSIEYTNDPELLAQMNKDPMVNHNAATIIDGGANTDDPDLDKMESDIDKLATVADEDTDIVSQLRDQKTRMEEDDRQSAAFKTSTMLTEQMNETQPMQNE